MAWEIDGTLVESCSCEMACPCWYGIKDLMVMDQGWCASVMLIRIDSGSCDGVDLSGSDIVVTTHFPGPTLLDGGGAARIYLDPSRSDEQRAALASIFQGERDGPMASLAGMVETWLPAEVTPIEVTEQRNVIRVSVPAFGQLRSSKLANHAGKAMTMQNVGFAESLELDDATAILAPSKGTSWADPELPSSWECKSGAVGTIHWRGI